MPLPEFPISAPSGKFPFLEGVQWEFKECDPAPAKIRETICAMLNAEGGYIVIGVTDSLTIRGLESHQVDRWLLLVDNFFHKQQLLHDDNTPLPLTAVRAEAVNLEGKLLARISVMPEADKKYKTNKGEMFCRLAASNLRIRADRTYCEDEVAQIRREAAAELREAIKEHKDVLTAVNRANRESNEARCAAATFRKQRDLAEDKAKEAEKSISSLRAALFAKILAEKAAAEKRLMEEASGCFKWAASLLCGLV